MPTYQGQFVSGQVLNAADLNAFTPAAYYTSSGTQSIPNNSSTELDFATNGNAGITSWVNTTTARITPNIQGYYLVTANVQMVGTTARVALTIRKNGTTEFSQDITSGARGLSLSGIVFLNGTTDYISGFAFQSSGAALNFSDYQLSVSLMWQ
jgi:hypothetical protein